MLRLLPLVLAACTLVSCQTTSRTTATTKIISARSSGHWHQVSKDPLTYFPMGTPANHPTGASDGFWVETGDEQGTRYFIPAHTSRWPQEQLIAEAQAAMTPEAKKKLRRQRDLTGAGEVGGAILRGVGALGGAMAGEMYKHQHMRRHH